MKWSDGNFTVRVDNGDGKVSKGDCDWSNVKGNDGNGAIKEK